jgi:hypothetical protein
MKILLRGQSLRYTFAHNFKHRGWHSKYILSLYRLAHKNNVKKKLRPCKRLLVNGRQREGFFYAAEEVMASYLRVGGGCFHHRLQIQP